MFKLIKELMNLRKSIEEKTKELNRLEKDINNRENIINNIKQNAQNEANIKSEGTRASAFCSKIRSAL